FLAELLAQVSHQINDSTEKCTVVIDALDEVDVTSLLPGTNTLFLPEDLPPSVCMVVTQRFTSTELRVDCAKQIFDLFSDSGDNIADIHEFLREKLRSPKLQRYLAANNITHDAFIEILSKKSEYNFMYLRFVIPELENGAYRHLDIDHLPIGLRGYYNDHWQRMRGLDESSWFAYRL